MFWTLEIKTKSTFFLFSFKFFKFFFLHSRIYSLPGTLTFPHPITLAMPVFMRMSAPPTLFLSLSPLRGSLNMFPRTRIVSNASAQWIFSTSVSRIICLIGSCDHILNVYKMPELLHCIFCPL